MYMKSAKNHQKLNNYGIGLGVVFRFSDTL